MLVVLAPLGIPGCFLESTPLAVVSAPVVVGVTLGALALALLVAFVVAMMWPWRVEATARAMTKQSTMSMAAGLHVAAFSASMAAILGGPGVAALHFRGRLLWKRPISLELLLDWLDEQASKPKKEDSRAGRLLKRAGSWLVDRTDLLDLPDLGLRVLEGLREVSLRGTITCGFANPARTGQAAAILFPLAGILAPLGVLDVSIDWSMRTRLDGSGDLSFRAVPARIALEGMRFVWNHVHPFRGAASTSPPGASITPVSTV